MYLTEKWDQKKNLKAILKCSICLLFVKCNVYQHTELELYSPKRSSVVSPAESGIIVVVCMVPSRVATGKGSGNARLPQLDGNATTHLPSNHSRISDVLIIRVTINFCACVDRESVGVSGRGGWAPRIKIVNIGLAVWLVITPPFRENLRSNFLGSTLWLKQKWERSPYFCLQK